MTWPYLRGEQHGKAKFTEAQIKSIVEQYIALCPNGVRVRGALTELALKNPWMSRQNIQFICQGKLWPHITQPLLDSAGLLLDKYRLPDCEDIYQRSSPFWETMNTMARQRRLQEREDSDSQ